MRWTRRAWISIAAATPAAAAWPEFRGPGGQGLAREANAPLRWGEGRNIAWSAPIPGRGWSSPVVRDGLVWLTAAEQGGASLSALAFEASSGRLIRQTEVFALDSAPSIHQKNSHASPTPILEDDRVYVHFGALGTAALDFDGRVVWTNREHRYNHGHGSGGSPEQWENLLIFSCDGTDRQFMAAVDKNDGRTAWTASRGRARMAYSTPLAIPRGDDAQIVSPGADRAVSYDPRTGRELWWITYDGFSNVPRPVYAHGLVYIASGFYDPTLFAVRPDGEGDVTLSHVAWTASRGVPLTPSPIVVGDQIHFVSDNGIASCLDARDGSEHWRKRLGGNFSASPTAVGERIYFTNETGETTVLRAGVRYEELARNQLGDETLASLAVDGEAIYLRAGTTLYRLEEGA